MYSWLTNCCSLTYRYVYFVKSLVMLLLCCYFSLYHCIWLYENKDILYITGAHGTELPPPNFLFTYLFSMKFLYYGISSLFPLLTCSCPYSYNLMLTPTCICRSYILYNSVPRAPVLVWHLFVGYGG